MRKYKNISDSNKFAESNQITLQLLYNNTATAICTYSINYVLSLSFSIRNC